MKGVVAAAITPRGPGGVLNLGSAFELIDYLCAAGIDGIALFTSHRDFCSIPPDDRIRVVSLGRKRSRVPLLVGTGSASFDLSVALAREARNAGASAVLLPPPLDYALTDDDAREFYRQFAAETSPGIDLYLAQAPLARVMAALDVGRFHGAVVTEDYLEPWLEAASRRNFAVWSANDTHPVSVGVGVLSILACAIPELVLGLRRANSADERERFAGLIGEFRKWTACLPESLLIHAAVSVRGIKMGPLPTPPGPATQRHLDEFREWFRGWLPQVKPPQVKKLPRNA